MGLVDCRARAHTWLGLVLLAVSAGGLCLVFAASAQGEACPAPSPHAKSISFTPSGGELPVHAKATFQASVGALGGSCRSLAGR